MTHDFSIIHFFYFFSLPENEGWRLVEEESAVADQMVLDIKDTVYFFEENLARVNEIEGQPKK